MVNSVTCRCSGECFWDACPFLVRDIVLMNVDIISKSVKMTTKDERSIHEWTRINKFTLLFDFHALDVEYEASIENLLSKGTFTSEDDYLIISDLIRQTHVSRNPSCLINGWSSNFLPNVFGNIVAFDCVYDIFLIDSSSKCEDVVVFEWTQGNTRSCYSKTINLPPLIFLDIIDFAEWVNLAIDESSNDVDEPFDSTKRMISMREYHRRFFIHVSENLIVSIAFLQVLVSSLVAASNQVYTSIFCCNWSWVKWYFKLHLNWSFFEFWVMNFKNISVLLIPLEWMNSAWHTWMERVLDVVINSEVWLNQVVEICDDLTLIFI